MSMRVGERRGEREREREEQDGGLTSLDSGGCIATGMIAA